MTVRLHHSREHACDPRALFELWTDLAFQRARSAHLGTLWCRAERTDAPGLAVIAVREARRTGWRTDPFESEHATRWITSGAERQGTWTGTWTLRRVAGPGDAAAQGTVRIEAAPGGRARLVLDGSLTIRVPVLAPMIERLAARGFRAERAREARFVDAWLRERGGT